MAPEKHFEQRDVKSVLLIDDNQEMCKSLKIGLEKYCNQLSVLCAYNGKQALDLLRREPVSVVISDVKMPEMKGLDLLSYVANRYPDIPVITIAAHGHEELERLARKSGAAAFISKPFSVDKVGNEVMALLQKQSNGGLIRGISVGVFMQLVEMEEMSSTMRVHSDSTGLQGVIFFRQGRLQDARYGTDTGEKAVLKILTLDKTRISIQNECPDLVKPKINSGLQAILLEATRLKDEAVAAEGMEGQKSGCDELPVRKRSKKVLPQPKASFRGDTLNCKRKSKKKIINDIRNEIGKGCDLHQVDSDPRWEHIVTLSWKIGGLLNAGCLKCGYIQKSNGNVNFFIPGSPSAILKSDHTCPRDQVFQIAGSRG